MNAFSNEKSIKEEKVESKQTSNRKIIEDEEGNKSDENEEGNKLDKNGEGLARNRKESVEKRKRKRNEIDESK